MNRANKITSNVIHLLSLQGCKVWRNNTVGIFDQKIAAAGLMRLFLRGIVDERGITRVLRASYRKSHELLGAADIAGCTRHGKFVAVEVKGKGDKLSVEQQNYLKEVHQKGGFACVVAEEPEKITWTVLGANAVPVCAQENVIEELKKFEKR